MLCCAPQEWASTVPGTHLWAFRPDYEAEAYERYGVKPADVHPLPLVEAAAGEQVHVGG